jgi:hypothetical protein
MVAKLTHTLHECFLRSSVEPVYYFDGGTVMDARLDPKHDERVARHDDSVAQLFSVDKALRQKRTKVLHVLILEALSISQLVCPVVCV